MFVIYTTLKIYLFTYFLVMTDRLNSFTVQLKLLRSVHCAVGLKSTIITKN